jgi:hypothetical protein
MMMMKLMKSKFQPLRETRVDNDNHFISFFAKKWLQTMIVLREKMMRLSLLSLFREKLNFSDNRDYREAIITISRFSPMWTYM